MRIGGHGEASGEDRGNIRHGFDKQNKGELDPPQTATLNRKSSLTASQMRDIAARRREEVANATGKTGRAGHTRSHHRQPLSGYDLARSPKCQCHQLQRPKRPRFAVKGVWLGLLCGTDQEWYILVASHVPPCRREQEPTGLVQCWLAGRKSRRTGEQPPMRFPHPNWKRVLLLVVPVAQPGKAALSVAPLKSRRGYHKR